MATTCVELFRTVDSAFRNPKLSHGGLNQATAFGEKFVPAITIGWVKEAFGGVLGLKPTLPASMDVMTGTGLTTNSAAAFDGAKFGCGLVTVTCNKPGVATKFAGT